MARSPNEDNFSKSRSCEKVYWMKDSSLKVCGSGFFCALAGRRFRLTLARLAECCLARRLAQIIKEDVYVLTLLLAKL